MRILIIGGTGFTGPHVVGRLTAMGHEVALLHRGKTGVAPPAGVRRIVGDRNRLEDSRDAILGFSPQVVLDMVASNERQARELVDLCRGAARRVVAISSQDVYRAYGKLIGLESGPLEAVPVTEESPLRQKLYPYRERVPEDHPGFHYEKILVERAYMSEAELPGTILRYPMVYGPGDAQHRLFPYLKRMDDGRPVIPLAESMAGWRWTKGFAENVAAAVVLAVTDERAAGRVYNVGEEETLTEADWIRAIGAAADWRGQVVPVPEARAQGPLAPPVDAAQQLLVDSSRIRRELGYAEVVPRDEALRRTVAWQRQHPPAHVEPQAFDYAAEDAVLAELEAARDD